MVEAKPMQYQVLVQNPSEQRFIASVIGLANVMAEGTTEEEVIARVKTVLVSELATAKLVTIEIDSAQELLGNFQAKHVGILAHDPTFDDWMEKMAVIRRQENEVRDDE
jgi:predicted RNase H-like HicB family nuclease